GTPDRRADPGLRGGRGPDRDPGRHPLPGRPALPGAAPARADPTASGRCGRAPRDPGGRRAVPRADRPGRPGRPARPRPAGRGPARGPGGPGAPGVAGPGRLRRQEPADRPVRTGAGAARRDRRHRRRDDRHFRDGGGMITHLLSASDLDPVTATTILDTAAELANVTGREVKKLPTLRGRTVVNLFYEDSTRTRISFEVAAKRLSADVINFSARGSSVAKGESLKDTALTLQAMGADAVVVRHSAAGAPHRLARWLEGSV